MAEIKTTGMKMRVEVTSVPSWRGNYTREAQMLNLAGKTLHAVVFEQNDSGKLEVSVVYLENGYTSEPVSLPSIKMFDVEKLCIAFHND